MKIYLTFDIEVWCDGWQNLDERFPKQFDRYVYGRSDKGEFALPKILEILDKFGLKGVFFVEPLFAARFGIEHLATIVNLIKAGDHDVQLHLHAEWADEIRPLPFAGASQKRQHLSYYTFEEQVCLLEMGRDMLEQVGCDNVSAFRAGSFACNHDTFRALRQIGIKIDSSLHATNNDSGVDLRGKLDFFNPQEFEQVTLLPLTVFRDGFGKLRPAQVGACSFAEMRGAITSAANAGVEHFVILSHNFEMLKQRSSEPDSIVVARFERLCAFLAAQSGDFEVAPMAKASLTAGLNPSPSLAQANFTATLRRHVEQSARRLLG